MKVCINCGQVGAYGVVNEYVDYCENRGRIIRNSVYHASTLCVSYTKYTTCVKIDQVDATLFIEQHMINIVIMAEQHC